MTSEFVDASAEYRADLRTLCEHTHELFENRNKAFRETSILFDDGGDYAEKEVTTCAASISDMMYQFEKQVSTHYAEGTVYCCLLFVGCLFVCLFVVCCFVF